MKDLSYFYFLLILSVFGIKAPAIANTQFDVDSAKHEITKNPITAQIYETLKTKEDYAKIYFFSNDEYDSDDVKKARNFMIQFYEYLFDDTSIDTANVKSMTTDKSMPLPIKVFAHQLLFYKHGDVDDAVMSMRERPRVGLYYLKHNIEDQTAIIKKYFSEMEVMEAEYNPVFLSELDYLAENLSLILIPVLKTGNPEYFEELMKYYPDQLVHRGAPSPREFYSEYGGRMRQERLAIFAKAIAMSRQMKADALKEGVEIIIEKYDQGGTDQ